MGLHFDGVDDEATFGSHASIDDWDVFSFVAWFNVLDATAVTLADKTDGLLVNCFLG